MLVRCSGVMELEDLRQLRRTAAGCGAEERSNNQIKLARSGSTSTILKATSGGPLCNEDKMRAYALCEN